MTQPTLDRFNKRNFLIKAQAAAGTDPVPTGALDGFRFFDGESSTDFDKVERKFDRAPLGNFPFGVANRRAMIKGMFELYPPATPGGAATSDADCAKVLLPAGMAVAKDSDNKITRYNPISDSFPLVAARFYHVDSLLNLLDGRADIASLSIEVLKRFTGQASITGSYSDVSSAVMVNAVLPTTVPVIASDLNTTFLLSTLDDGLGASGGAALDDLECLGKSLSADFANKTSRNVYTGLAETRITDREPTFSFRIARTDIAADFNPWYVRDNNILIQAVMRLYNDNSKDGLYSELGVRGQIDKITRVDIDGDYGWDITGNCVPSDAGNDELWVAFGDASV